LVSSFTFISGQSFHKKWPVRIGIIHLFSPFMGPLVVYSLLSKNSPGRIMSTFLVFWDLVAYHLVYIYLPSSPSLPILSFRSSSHQIYSIPVCLNGFQAFLVICFLPLLVYPTDLLLEGSDFLSTFFFPRIFSLCIPSWLQFRFPWQNIRLRTPPAEMTFWFILLFHRYTNPFYFTNDWLPLSLTPDFLPTGFCWPLFFLTSLAS